MRWTSREGFSLPAVLREYAGLDKEVILAGASKKIEIWNKDRYLADQKEYEDNIDEIAANMEKFECQIFKEKVYGI